MPKTPVPHIRAWRRGSKGHQSCDLAWSKGVEVTTSTGSHYFFPTAKILDRKTTWIKFNRTCIITCEFTDRNKILDEFWGVQNVGQNKPGIG